MLLTRAERRVHRRRPRQLRESERARRIVNPAVLQRLGRPSVRLAVRRVGAAGDPAAHVARSRLRPPLVQQLLRLRQHQHRGRATSTLTTITAPTNAKLPDGGGYPVTYHILKAGREHGRSRTGTRSPATTATGRTTGTAWTSRVNSRLRQRADAPDRVEHGPRDRRQLRRRGARCRRC